jgi:hypothetical protein
MNMRWNKARQDDARRLYVRRAFWSYVLWTIRHRRDVLALADERHEKGWVMYEDTMWLWSQARLDKARMEEAADGVNYTIAKMATKKGRA